MSVSLFLIHTVPHRSVINNRGVNANHRYMLSNRILLTHIPVKVHMVELSADIQITGIKIYNSALNQAPYWWLPECKWGFLSQGSAVFEFNQATQSKLRLIYSHMCAHNHNVRRHKNLWKTSKVHLLLSLRADMKVHMVNVHKVSPVRSMPPPLAQTCLVNNPKAQSQLQHQSEKNSANKPHDNKC